MSKILLRRVESFNSLKMLLTIYFKKNTKTREVKIKAQFSITEV